MTISPFALDVTELFDVLPQTTMHAGWIGEPDQVDRWETLNGDHRSAEEIVTNPALQAGTAYWVHDVLHALVLRNAARHQQRNAEALWDTRFEQYAVLVTHCMPSQD